MRNAAFLFLVSIVVAAVSVSSAYAEGGKFGVGIEVEHVSFELVNLMMMDEGDELFFDVNTVSMTPAFLVSLRFTPNIFVEPSLGIANWSTTETYTGDEGDWEATRSTRDIKFGIGGLYVFNPDEFVSPFVHVKFDLHSLLGKYEESGDEDDFTAEVSGLAMTMAGGFGGMVNIKDSVFLTIEGRILYARQMDPESTRSGEGWEEWEDEYETTQSKITTDMVLGLRIIF